MHSWRIVRFIHTLQKCMCGKRPYCNTTIFLHQSSLLSAVPLFIRPAVISLPLQQTLCREMKRTFMSGTIFLSRATCVFQFMKHEWPYVPALLRYAAASEFAGPLFGIPQWSSKIVPTLAKESQDFNPESLSLRERKLKLHVGVFVSSHLFNDFSR
jgi:hypothetical protein